MHTLLRNFYIWNKFKPKKHSILYIDNSNSVCAKQVEKRPNISYLIFVFKNCYKFKFDGLCVLEIQIETSLLFNKLIITKSQNFTSVEFFLIPLLRNMYFQSFNGLKRLSDFDVEIVIQGSLGNVFVRRLLLQLGVVLFFCIFFCFFFFNSLF